MRRDAKVCLPAGWPVRSRFDVCRISFRKTGIHFSGKCSNGLKSNALEPLEPVRPIAPPTKVKITWEAL